MPHFEETTEQQFQREDSILRGDAISKYMHLDSPREIQDALASTRDAIQNFSTQRANTEESSEMMLRRLEIEESVLQEFLLDEQLKKESSENTT